MIKVSDFIAKFIAEHKDTAKTVFMVSGGGNMHLIDSLGKNENLEYVCNHHEQACAIAAEGYARVSNKIGIAYVTTGPGGTNAITGVYGAWVDSIPTMIISGQVKFQTTIASQPQLNLRQLGDQEVNIIDIVKPITKYAVMITDKNSIKFHLQKAVYEAKHGRPGPVWLDVPLDIQGAMVDEADLIEFEIPEATKFDTKIPQVLDALKVAKRPVIIVGNGVTLAGANEEFLKLIEILKIPVIGTFARYDIVRNDHELFFGRYGTIGNRAANFVVQNSDLIIAIGARLNIRAVSYNWEFFGREAKKILVDIDQNELNKKTIAADIKIKSDAKVFISDLRSALKDELDFGFWLEICKNYRKNYPTIEPFRQNVKEWVDSYNFFDVLSNHKRDLVYVFGNGTACVSSYQSLRLYENQKVVVNSGCASMGYDLPAAIGACFANGKKDTICVTGEGSLQMNIQELQTIIHNKLPIKIFVLNNAGYISIRNTQNNFFKGHKVGSDKDSGVSFPNIVKLAEVYGFEACRIENQLNLKGELEEILSKPGAVVCEIMLSPTEKMEPKLSSKIKPDGKMVSKPLEDMFPFLPREEFYKNMIIKPVDE
ncbi:thiamine pyrophosphate-binding protein [uncultured Campylobacter sp.]|mgnify:FL=1|uniref:thiamine pyrophosphate-binding protein n=1 Tax=uncultured Campylobacter sp. TaxID=218934 RepID=UPI00260AB931|nr:thiamine pyrophosphate-binding protein [uncultured Campylobacter sp.]